MGTLIGMAMLLALMLGLVVAADAGTWRDDFEEEQDFLNDKRQREGGVWGEDIHAYTWEDRAIKGTNQGNNFFLSLITGDYAWSDYTVECRVKVLKIEMNAGFIWIGLMLRRPCIDCNPAYYFIFTSQSQVSVQRQGGVLGTEPFDLELERWYQFRATVEDEWIAFYIDDELILDAKDATHRAGKAGVLVWHGVALFDDFVMSGPEVTDGGHWNPQVHPDLGVKPTGKLTTTWAHLKC